MELGQAIHAAAERLGIDPLDLATVISYETGGTFSPSIVGGKNNAHVGLIQFGGPERAKYGAHAGQSAAEQMEAVVRYLADRGVTPGMGLLDIYSTVNAGTPGRYSASDGPGNTVKGHVAKMDPHRAKAAELLKISSKRPANPSDVGGMPGAEMPVAPDFGQVERMEVPQMAPQMAPQQPDNGLGALFAGLGSMGGGQGPQMPLPSPAAGGRAPKMPIEVAGPQEPAEPVVAQPVENTDLGALLQHISGGLQPPPSPAPRPASRRA